jgi:Rad3-related DNA helicase
LAKSDILTHFAGTPRPEQTEALREIQARWREADVFLVRGPVGCGKSLIADCLTRWTGQGGIVAPTNNLVSQYARDIPDLATIRHRADYAKPEDWVAAKAAFAAAPRFVGNYFTYLAHRNYRRVMVFDEAHRLIPTLQDQEAVRLWDHEYKVPDWVRTTTDLQAWAEQGAQNDARLSKLADRLATHPDTFTVDVSWERWRGRVERCWTLRPLTPRLNRPVLWPAKVKKLVLMSATLYPEDLWDLGLETRRVAVIQVGSPIPARQRPVVYAPCANPAFHNRAAAIPALRAQIERLASRHAGVRGFVHTTYQIAAELKSAGLVGTRWWYHTPQDAGARYAEWLRAGGDGVFVGCGMSEGLDLAGDLARWQVVTKVGYPSKADPAVLAKLQVRPDWYVTTAVRELEQAVGRVCRGPDDWGVTYIITEEFPNLYRRGQALGLWSPSFVASLDTEGA